MNPPNMVLHIVHTTENPSTPIPLTNNARIMLGLMPSTVLLTREPALLRLRTPLMPTEEMLPVSIEMLPQVTTSTEHCLGRTARVGAAPDAVSGRNAVSCEIGWV